MYGENLYIENIKVALEQWTEQYYYILIRF